MAGATITSKGQITIPVQIRNALGVSTGDRVEFVELKKGEFAIVAHTRSLRELNGMFKGRRGKPASVADMDAAIVRGIAESR